MLGGADNPNGELPSYITGADTTGTTVPVVVMITPYPVAYPPPICFSLLMRLRKKNAAVRP